MKRLMVALSSIFFVVFITISGLLSIQTFADVWSDYYSIETIDLPKNVNPQIGGLTTLKDGRIAVAFHDGQVLIFNTQSKGWSQFASGLHEPLGLIEERKDTLVVSQLGELTRLIDEDANGQADVYQTISDEFGISGNYHEFVFGPAVDSEGNFYISLNLASNFAGINDPARGPYSELCPPEAFMASWRRNENWKLDKAKAGRMYSCVGYRGWVLKVSPDGTTTPFASGLRSPDGIYIDSKDRLWVTDNQGDWIPTSPLLSVKQGDFLGHPASLYWRDEWDTPQTEVSKEQLLKLKKPAAALMPHGELANSPTQPIEITPKSRLGLPVGELLIGDMNQPNLIRFIEDEIEGVMQGALIPFIEGEQLGIGNHRFTFDRDGALWIGKTHLGWAGDEGIRKVGWSGEKPFIIKHMKQTTNGFELMFSQALRELPDVKLTRHRYNYHANYGSEKIDFAEVALASAKLSFWKNRLKLEVAELQEGFVYTLSIKNAVSKTDQELLGDVARYTLNKKK